jgi:hypothetical protein
MTTIDDLSHLRAERPEAVAEAAAARARPTSPFGPHGSVLIIAADHPARGMVSAGKRGQAMADRPELLRRLVAALERPGVNGVLGTPDVLEDLLLLGALDEKFVVGSMNRGGLGGASFEMDDRFTAYDAPALARDRLDGGKLLLRIDGADPVTVRTLEASAHAVTALAANRLMAMVEPFISARQDGRVRNELTADAVIRSIGIAAGLGTTSAYTWLKLPVVPEMKRVVSATTLPCLLLGGEVSDDRDSTFAAWQEALALPNVFGLVVGRSLLFPANDDVEGAVDGAIALLHASGPAPVR